jgi:hypothetical protein
MICRIVCRPFDYMTELHSQERLHHLRLAANHRDPSPRPIPLGAVRFAAQPLAFALSAVLALFPSESRFPDFSQSRSILEFAPVISLDLH